MSSGRCAVLLRLRRRLRLELLLEFGADALIVLAVIGAILVFLDWWFRFGVQVRLVLLLLALAGVLVFLGLRAFRRYQASRLDELTLAMTLDRHRPGTGQQIADVLQLPELLNEEGSTVSQAMVRLAVQRDRGAGWVGLAHALESQAYGCGDCGSDPGIAAAALVLPGRSEGGAIECGALAIWLVAAMAAADLSHRDGLEHGRGAAGAAG